MRKQVNKIVGLVFTSYRDPRYIFVLFGALLTYSICFAQVRNQGMFDSLEQPIFEYLNSLPRQLFEFMYAITQLGGLTSIAIWMAAAWYWVNRRAAILLAATGIAAWSLAKVAKAIAHRGRPGDLLHNVHLFQAESLTGFGFPSGHATLSAACITILYYQVPQWLRKYLLLVGFSVGVSRMYLGAHFPLDIVGGWALGAMIGAVFALVFGTAAKTVPAAKLKKFLIRKGLEVTSLTYANVDARGSRPVFITTADGKEHFGKLFGKQEHAADWLFKIFRFFRYKNLQAEEPHISSRRNVEIEAFAMLWARQAGIRVTKVIDIYNYGSYWLSIQQKLDAKPLSDMSRVLQTSLVDTWRQVAKLHAANIAHRDLRAANIMIDKQGKAWLIDFGFAEVAASRQRQNMDSAELLMSMTLVVGVKRTVAAALEGIDKKQLKGALPYLQTAVFSGATTKLLKQNKHLLSELKDKLKEELHITEDVEQVDVLRINMRKLFNILLLAVFVYIIAPQFSDFRHAFSSANLASPVWLIPLAAFSLATYVLTGLIYVILADVPLKVRESSIVQLAASFMSKILPGVGSTTLNVRYLTKAGMDALATSAVISAQAVIGFVMFIVPLGLFLALNGANIFKLMNLHVSLVIVLIIATALLIAAAVVAFVPKIRAAVSARVIAGLQGLQNITTSTRQTVLASAASLAVTGAYIACLYYALQCVGVTIGISTAILVYATAVIAKTAIPTPGGLGPVEAAMIATLVSFGVDRGAAVSGVLIYRLATFWLPIPFSLLAYKYATKKKLI